MKWVTLAELLVTSGLLLSFGRLADQWGCRRVYVAGLFVFIAGALLCAGAPSIWWLVAFRVVQGTGAAMLLSSSPAILANNIAADCRAKAFGFRASFTYLGLIVGPAVGGWFAQQYGWRSVFWLETPAGIVGLMLGWYSIPSDRGLAESRVFDFAGACTWLCALAAFLLALNRLQLWGWKSPQVLAPLAVSLMLTAIFLAVERRAPNTMMDLTLFGRPMFAVAVLSLALSFVCTYMLVFLLPFYLIQARGFRAATVGLLISANALARTLAAPVSGALSDRVGAQLPQALGMGTLALGLVWLSRANDNSPLSIIIAAVLLANAGMGMFISPNNAMILDHAAPSQRGMAAGILATSRTFGMATGVALAAATLTSAGSLNTGFSVAAAAAIPGAILCTAAWARRALSTYALNSESNRQGFAERAFPRSARNWHIQYQHRLQRHIHNQQSPTCRPACEQNGDHKL